MPDILYTFGGLAISRTVLTIDVCDFRAAALEHRLAYIFNQLVVYVIVSRMNLRFTGYFRGAIETSRGSFRYPPPYRPDFSEIVS